jgi:hypothetical protein
VRGTSSVRLGLGPISACHPTCTSSRDHEVVVADAEYPDAVSDRAASVRREGGGCPQGTAPAKEET